MKTRNKKKKSHKFHGKWLGDTVLNIVTYMSIFNRLLFTSLELDFRSSTHHLCQIFVWSQRIITGLLGCKLNAYIPSNDWDDMEWQQRLVSCQWLFMLIQRSCCCFYLIPFNHFYFFSCAYCLVVTESGNKPRLLLWWLLLLLFMFLSFFFLLYLRCYFFAHFSGLHISLIWNFEDKEYGLLIIITNNFSSIFL